MCSLGKTDIILGIPQLQAHNPEINQETKEVKIIKCLPLCGRNTKLKERQKVKKEKRVVILKEKKIVKQAIDNKENQRREEEVKVDHRKIKDNGSKKISKVKESIWESRIGENTNKENLKSCYKFQENI